jgi:hypothetical protein
LLKRRFPVFFRGVEVPDDVTEDVRADVEQDRMIVDSGADLPDVVAHPDADRRSRRLVLADAEVIPNPANELDQTQVEGDVHEHVDDENGGDRDVTGQNGGDERNDSVEPTVSTEPAGISFPVSRPVLEQPWHLTGAPVVEGVARVRKQTKRYGMDVNYASVDNVACSPCGVPSGRAVPNGVNGRHSLSMYDQYTANVRRMDCAYNIRVDAAIKSFGKKAIDSMVKELTSAHSKGVFSQVNVKRLSMKEKKSIIRGRMFLKEKYLPNGQFEKLKSRYVAGGHLQDRSIYSDSETSSPTLSLASLYILMNLAARERRHVGTMDIGTAYLNADMVRDVHMRVEPRLSSMLAEISPADYVPDADGTVVVKLNKALYGCVESSKLWYDMLSKSIMKKGFIANPKDPCVFNLNRYHHQVTIGIYVDDIVCTSIDEADIEWVAEWLREEYKQVTLNLGYVHSYLGQTFDFMIPGQVSVSMAGYVRDILDDLKVEGNRATPAVDALFDVTEGLEPLDEETMKQYHSVVARILYLAQRVRPDLLTAISFLTSRVGKCTSEDWDKLQRVLMYLNGDPDLCIILRPGESISIFAYIDASFAVHPGMNSHTGGVLSMGQGPFYVMSKKQGLVTKSSTESELVGVSDVLPQVIWSRDFLIAQGYDMSPSTIYQDNMSTITLANKGRSTSARTRHVAIRYFFVKDRIDSKEVSVEYLPTGEMIADILTKPLQGDLFRRMRAWLMGHSVERISLNTTQ